MRSQTEQKTHQPRRGRAARVATRAAPLAEHMRPVRAGLTGGQYRPRTEAHVPSIQQAALDAREEVGPSLAPQGGGEPMVAAGPQQGLLVYSVRQNTSTDFRGVRAAVVVSAAETHTRPGFVTTALAQIPGLGAAARERPDPLAHVPVTPPTILAGCLRLK